MNIDLVGPERLRDAWRAPRAFATARASGGASASGLSEAVRRLEAQLGVRLLQPDDAQRRAQPRPASACWNASAPR